MPGPIVTLRQLGVKRGLLGGSRAWTVVGVTLWSLRLIRRMAGKHEEVLTVEKLKPGQTVVVTALAPKQSRRQARRASHG